MKNKIRIIPKNKKCYCGKTIKHHHFLCDSCWKEQLIIRKLQSKTFKEIKNTKTKHL